MPCLFHANLFALGGARWRFRNISVISVAKMIRWVAYFRHLGTFLFCRHLGTLLVVAGRSCLTSRLRTSPKTA